MNIKLVSRNKYRVSKFYFEWVSCASYVVWAENDVKSLNSTNQWFSTAVVYIDKLNIDLFTTDFKELARDLGNTTLK